MPKRRDTIPGYNFASKLSKELAELSKCEVCGESADPDSDLSYMCAVEYTSPAAVCDRDIDGLTVETCRLCDDCMADVPDLIEDMELGETTRANLPWEHCGWCESQIDGECIEWGVDARERQLLAGVDSEAITDDFDMCRTGTVLCPDCGQVVINFMEIKLESADR